jgi:hypothetical protein
MKLVTYLVVALCTCVLPAYTYGQTPVESPRLKQATECMLKILKAVHDVRDPKVGTGIATPYVEYRAAENARWRNSPTRFVLQPANKGVIFFQAMLPGMTTVSSLPDTHITNIVIKKWKAQCGVQAAILFE